MITEANQYDVLALARQIERSAAKFCTLSEVRSSVRSNGDLLSVTRRSAAEQVELDHEFNRLAALLGYTVKAEEVTK